MVNDLFKKVVNLDLFATCRVWINHRLKTLLNAKSVGDVSCYYHLQNVIILLSAYLGVSVLIYPSFNLVTQLREIFSLSCVYWAIVFFDNKNTTTVSFTIVSATTAGVAPLLFINNSFAVAAISVLLIIVAEFILIQYMQKSRLFDATIPVYIVCESTEQAEFCQKFVKSFKVLETVVLTDQGNGKLKSIDEMKKWLYRINRVPFYPFPRRLLYFASQINEDDLTELMSVSSEFSVPLFKISDDSADQLCVKPVTFSDFDNFELSPQDRSELSPLVRNKKIWICYDVRQVILDFAYALLSSDAVLTVLCETELLAACAKRELFENRKCKNIDIKITNFELIDFSAGKPDVLFFTMPVNINCAREGAMREVFIQNVLVSHRVVQNAQLARVSNIFMLSSSEINSLNNWVGATQKLGEMVIRFMGSKNARKGGKVKIIRLPEKTASGVLNQLLPSIALRGQVGINYDATTLLSYNKDITLLLVKAFVMSLKTYADWVYTIVPSRGVTVAELVQYVCNAFCLRKGLDVSVNYSSECPNKELGDFSNLSEDQFEQTDVVGVLRTKITNIDLASYQNISSWALNKVNSMSTRDLIEIIAKVRK